MAVGVTAGVVTEEVAGDTAIFETPVSSSQQQRSGEDADHQVGQKAVQVLFDLLLHSQCQWKNRLRTLHAHQQSGFLRPAGL